ncbi:MAG: RNA polymerase sigma factor [Bacteroidota bacterium]
MTDAQLIAQCLSNNRLAQKKLYDRYKTAMYTLAYRICDDFGLAEEVLQDAFLKVFRYLHTFRQESTLGAWIKRIVVRTAYKKVKKLVRFEPIDHEVKEAIDWGDSLDTDYLEKAIQALPEGYRMVFVLVEVEGYSHREVGDLLGISAGTSKSQLFYAKKKLRAMIR